MDEHSVSRINVCRTLRWIICVLALLPVSHVSAGLGLFGVRLCQGQRPEVLACPVGTVIQFVDVIFSLTSTDPKDPKSCAGKEACRKSVNSDGIMSERYDVCIRQTACDIDSRTDWVSCPQLYTANYTEVIYTCVTQEEFSLTLPENRTAGRPVTYGVSAEDAARYNITSSTSTKPTTPQTLPTSSTTIKVATLTASTKPPIWIPATDDPTIIGEESTIILAAALAFVVFAFCCVLCGFAIAYKRGRIDKKKLPRCLIRAPSELPPDHVYSDIDYTTMYPRFRDGGSDPTAATLQPQQLLKLPYMEFVHAGGHLTPVPRTDPYYFVYDPAHRSVIPVGALRPTANGDPLFRSTSVVLERHPLPMATPMPQHAHTHHRHHGRHHPSRSCGQQELPDLVHHESHGSGSINASFSEHISDPSGVMQDEDVPSTRLSQQVSTSLPDVSVIAGRHSTSSTSSAGVGPMELLGIPQTVVSRQVTIDSAFEDDFENTDESYSSNNHLAVDRQDSKFMMDSHEYLAPVVSGASIASGRTNQHTQLRRNLAPAISLAPRYGGDIHSSPTKRVRGGLSVALPPISSSTPCSPVNQGKNPLFLRGNIARSRHSKNKGVAKSDRKKSEASEGGDVPVLENKTPTTTPSTGKSESSDLSSSSNGLKFSPSVRV